MIRKLIALIVVAGLFLLPATANAGKAWIKAESPHFVVYSDTDRKTTEAYVMHLEQYRYVMDQLYDRPAVQDGTLPKFNLYFLANREDIQQVSPNIPTTADGFYKYCNTGQTAFSVYFDDRIVDKKRITDQPENMSQFIIFHEYARHFLSENPGQLYPYWFARGFADYYGSARIQDDIIAMGIPTKLNEYGFQDGSVKYEDVLRNSTQIIQSGNSYIFNAQAWLLTHWFMSTAKRQAQLYAYIDAYNNREDPVASFERTTGVAVKDLAKVLNNYKKTMQVEMFQAKDMPVPAIKIIDMPASAQDLLLPDASARLCMQQLGAADGNTKFIKDAHAAADRWPNDDYASLAVARIDVQLGDESRALPWLKAYAQAHPDNSDVASLLGETYYLMSSHDKIAEGETKASQMKRARESLFRAYKLDPLNAGNLYYLSLAQKDLPDYPNDIAINAAIQAHNLIPAVTDYTLTAANLLIQKDRFEEARSLLAPMSNNSNGGSFAKWADSIIVAIDSGKHKAEIIKLYQAPIEPEPVAKNKKRKP